MQRQTGYSGFSRLRSLHLLLFILGGVAVARLAYLQVAQHDHYAALASNEHQRKYEVAADRGQIYVEDGDTKVPLALNQTLKIVYADPSIISDKTGTAAKLASATGDPADGYVKALNNGTEYAILKTKVSEGMASKIADLKLHGVGMKNQDYRTYPEGGLAAQTLGFVNNDGEGQYGIEGALNAELKGSPGTLNAKTDTNGVPIATTDNLSKSPVNGNDLVLTLDRNIQAQAEKFLKDGVENVKAESGSVIVLDPKSGAVKAMANYPSFDPNSYTTVKDYHTFENATVSNAFEPGSGFKVFTMAAGLDTGKVHPDTTYNDEGCVEIDKHKICNASDHKDGPNTTMTMVLRDSLNTGVIFVLRSLGVDPNTITPESKKSFYNYISDRFGFGKRTGIEQATESKGVVNPPTSNNTNYANMTFGQGISVTMLQMASAVGAIANGGTLYKPYLVDERQKVDGSTIKTQPYVVNNNVMSKQASSDLTQMMEVVVEHGSGYLAATPGYKIAGKTGTAQIPDPNGGYLATQNIGTFVGFAPAEAPKFVVMVRVNKPHVDGFAEKTTVPIFASLTRWLLQYYSVPPSG
jgi:cell division protein FtsI/penicillin-binding protein 2